MRNVRKIRDLAVGGMGRVELVVAHDGGFARAYVRKRLLSKVSSNGDAVAMFLEEGRIAALLRHANVVPVIDAGEDAEGPYLLMDLVDGVPLGKLVQRFPLGVPVQVAVEIARQVAVGLHAAHELVAPGNRPMALVHRDLSPGNVLLGFDGVARVTDFGVARAADRTMTQPDLIVGKRSYMAPEQARAASIDRRADLFSLGVVLVELLRGEPVSRTAGDAVPDPGDDRADLPAELVALIFELTALDPAARPATARDVATRLAAIHRALVQDEDPIELGELLRTTFADERAKMAAELSRILEDDAATHNDIAITDAPSLRSQTPVLSPGAGGRARPEGGVRLRTAILALSLVALTAMVAGGWFARPADEEPTVPSPAPPPVVLAPTDDVEGASIDLGPSPDEIGAAPEMPLEGAIPAVVLSAPESGDDEAEPSRRRRRRVVRDRPGTGAAAVERRGVRTWEWE